MVDSAAESDRLGDALVELETDGIAYGDFALTVAIHGPLSVTESLDGDIRRIFTSHDAKVIREGYGQLPAWFSRMPAQPRRRQCRSVFLSAGAVASMAPIFGPPVGTPRSGHLKKAPRPPSPARRPFAPGAPRRLAVASPCCPSPPFLKGSRGLPLARVYVKHKHILLLLLINVSFPVGVCARGNGDPASSASTLGGSYPGFGLGFVVGPLARSAAVWCKYFVFSSLPIRKVLVLPFWEGRLPLSWVFSLLFSARYSQDRRSYYLFFTTCVNTPFWSKNRECNTPFWSKNRECNTPFWSWITSQNSGYLWINSTAAIA